MKSKGIINAEGMAKRIKTAREGQGLTQEKLAEKASLSVAVISKAETGRTINLQSLALIADALGLSLDYTVRGFINDSSVDYFALLDSEEKAAVMEIIKQLIKRR